MERTRQKFDRMVHFLAQRPGVKGVPGTYPRPMDSDEPCSCADCPSCMRRAAKNVAGYVAEKRFRQRGSYNRDDPKERAYVHRQVKMLLAMTGLGPESMVDSEEVKRSDWGRAMRERQSSQ